jgi:3',5'-cyclic AMP phosphodiesterase CpdA
MTTLHFAQISDIHISSLGDHHEMLSGRAAKILAGIVAELNQMTDLDFVLITGDLFDQGSHEEFKAFQEVIQALKKPFYILPGNHDRRPAESSEGLTRHEFARHFNPQIEARPSAPKAQVGYWSIEVHPQVQLIGLDSVRDQDWGGIVDDIQIEWLQDELANHADKLVIVGIHHPLHPLSPIDQDPAWSNFVCDNGPELLTLLDDYPQVKMVLTAHHHLPKVDKVGQRLHVANPAIVIYPCGYRTFRLTRRPANPTWQMQWQMHHATDAATIAEARDLLADSLRDVGFTPDFAEEYVSTTWGSDYDRNGTAQLV